MRINYLHILFTSLFVSLTTIQASIDFTVNGLNYSITDITSKTVKVTNMYSYAPVDGNVVIPSKVINVGDATEYTVTGINKNCFYQASITSVFIPKTVTKIDTSAFEQCRVLETITFEDGNNISCISRAAFSYCDKLTDLILPDNITVIENYAFLNCVLLETVTLPNQIITIHPAAFMDLPSFNTLICLSATPPILPDPGSVFYLTAIGNDTLRVPPGAKSNYAGIFPWNAFKEIKAKNLWKDVGNFSDINFIITDESSKNVKLANLRNYAPIDGNVIIPSTVTNNLNDFVYTVTGIDKNCFENSKITSVFIPNTITRIDTTAFRECKELLTVTFESGSTMSRIYYASFSYCNKLTNLVLPESITFIENYAFLSNPKLESITIPNQIVTINPTAFMDLPALDKLICLSATPPTSPDFGSVFYQTPIQDVTLYVPQGAKSTYDAISPWNGFLEIVEIISTDVKQTQKDNESIKVSRTGNLVLVGGLSNHFKIAIYDITGKIIFSKSITEDVEQFNLPKGSYIIKVDGIARKINM